MVLFSCVNIGAIVLLPTVANWMDVQMRTTESTPWVIFFFWGGGVSVAYTEKCFMFT